MKNLTLFYEKITNIDLAFFTSSQEVLGLSRYVHVELHGHLNKEGMIYDFSKVKKEIKNLIDCVADHKIILPNTFFQHPTPPFTLPLKNSSETIIYQSPEEAYLILPHKEVTFETLGAYLEEKILEILPPNIKGVSLIFEDNLKKETSPLEFNYTHGLKFHLGNCQRLLHGHTSTLRIHRNKKREKKLEEEFFEQYFSQTLHFTCWNHVDNKEEIAEYFSHHNPCGISTKKTEGIKTKTSYRGTQGFFSLEMPLSRCFFIQEECTIENIILEVSNQLLSFAPQKDLFELTLYEGLGKGAKICRGL